MKSSGLCRRFMWLAMLLVLWTGEAGAAMVVLAPAKDNTLYESVTGVISNGAGENLFAGRTAGNLTRRAVLAFDVASQVPAGSTVNSASLRLTVTRSSSPTSSIVSIHPVTREWGEGVSNAGANEGSGAAASSGDATWVHTFFPGELWSSPGGDFEPVASATFPVGGLATYTWSSAELTADVQQWVDNPGSNFGWIMIGNEGGPNTAKRFASRENPLSGVRPSLTVDYTPPSGGGTLHLTAGVNQPAFTTADTLRLSIGVSNSGQARTVDVYAVIVLPDGNTLVNFTELDGTFEFGSLAALGSLQPLVTALPLAGAFNASLSPFFTYDWTGGEPAGNYGAFLVMAQAGSFSDGAIGAGDIVAFASASFTFTP